MIINTKLFRFIQNEMIKANRNANKFLDPRSWLDEEERAKEYKKYTQLEAFWEKLILRVEKEPFKFSTEKKWVTGINIPKSTYTDNLFKWNFRPDLTGKDFDTLTIN